MNVKNSLVAGVALLALASCQQKSKDDNTARKFIDVANLDTTVSPADNFFLYANGGWLNNNTIPESEARWGRFEVLREDNMNKLHTMLDEAAATKAKAGSAEQKVGDFYKSGMDSAAIDKAGLTPLNDLMARIDKIQDANGLVKEIAYLHTQGNAQLFSFYVGPDDKEVTKQVCQLGQGGLGLPDRDYYFNKDDRSAKMREAYKAYQVKLMELMGMDNATAQKAAAGVYALEEKLAAASMTRTEMRDPYKVYNKFSLDELSKKTPGMNWKQVLADMKVTGEDTILVGMPEFMSTAAKLVQAEPVNTWKAYLKFHIVNDMAPYLATNISDANFEFYGKAVSGLESQKPRWKRVLRVIDGGIGELLGKTFVDKYFTPDAKERMLALVKNLQQTYQDRIMRLDWMSDATKQKAIAKLNTFVNKIGYPDKWRDYSKLNITADNYVKNIFASGAFDYDYMVSKLGKPVDRNEWFMTPPTVNAYYNPAFNEIVFPAGILAFPFFDKDADDAINYGGIGGVIGHEMTHGFDDQGAKYDADGNLRNWWTDEDAKNFQAKTGVVVDQFNNYTVLDTVHVNGMLTLGENLADLGGLAIAYEAFQKTEQAKKGEKIDGFTPNQRFFLSWAQVWCTKSRDAEAANRIVTDPHSPAEWRTNGPLSNMPEFYQAFNVKPGDKMYRADSIRAKVW